MNELPHRIWPAARYANLCLSVAGWLIIATSAMAEELTVSAAASLSDAFKAIGRGFEQHRPGTKVVFNFAASGPLLQQIGQGAPVDVLATADQETMDRGEAQSLIDRQSRFTFARNALVLVVPANAGAIPKSLGELGDSVYRRIAVGNPASVPAGRYAREAIDTAGVANVIKDKLIFGDSVRQVLTYVARAEVDAGFAYRTDALIDAGRVKVALELPTRTPVTYPIAVVSASKQASLARDFIAYVRSPEALSVLGRFGFGTP